MHRSLNVVDNFIRLDKKYATKKSTGSDKKLSQTDKGKILQEARRNKLNSSQIKRKLDLPIVVRRAQQVLKKSILSIERTLRYTEKKKVKKPPLTKFHKDEKLKFAEEHMG